MLTKYTCTGCNTHPSQEKEIFYGCSTCGNKLFKLIEENSEKNNHSSSMSLKNEHTKDLQLTPIALEASGVFQIDVEKLLETNSSGIVAVSDKNGIIHIKL